MGTGLPANRRGRGERTLALVLGTALVIGCLEVGLRLTTRLYWRAELSAAERLHPTPAEATTCTGCARIVVAGDSFTFGFGASAGGDYPSQLQRLLDASGAPRAVVVNNGMGGANTTLARQNLERILEEVPADLVILLAGGSNALNLYQYYAFAWDEPWLANAERLVYDIRTLRLLRFLWARTHPPAKPPLWEDDLQDVALTASVRAARRRYVATDAGPDPARKDLAGAMDLLEQGRPDLAVPRFEALRTAGVPGATWGLGVARTRSSRAIDPAVAGLLEEAIRIDPADPLPYEALGDMEFWGHQRFRAAAVYRRGIEAAPQGAGNWCGLGNALAADRAYEAAHRTLLEGLARDPEERRCYPALVAISQLLGKQEATADALEARADTSDLARHHAALLRDERRTASAWMRSDLEAMVALARSHGAGVLLQDYPTDNEANAVLRSVAESAGLPFVSHRAVFEERLAAGTPEADLFIPDGHCNDAGYRIMAETLVAAILEQRLLPDVRSTKAQQTEPSNPQR